MGIGAGESSNSTVTSSFVVSTLVTFALVPLNGPPVISTMSPASSPSVGGFGIRKCESSLIWVFPTDPLTCEIHN